MTVHVAGDNPDEVRKTDMIVRVDLDELDIFPNVKRRCMRLFDSRERCRDVYVILPDRRYASEYLHRGESKIKSMSNDKNESVFEVVHFWTLTACQSSPDCFLTKWCENDR